MSPEPPKPGQLDPGIEKMRINRAFWIAVIGFIIAASLVFGLLGAGIRNSSDIVSIVGIFTSVLGTIVGAFFGLQIGSAGTAKAEDRADKAQQTTNAVLSAASPEQIQKAKDLFPNAFK